MRIALLLLACGLTACCVGEPIARDAQAQIDAIKAEYSHAIQRKELACSAGLPSCPDLRRDDYEAAAKIVAADTERTAQSIQQAKIAVAEFSRRAKSYGD